MKRTNQEKWNDLLNYIRYEFEISDIQYKTFIKDLELKDIADQKAYVLVEDFRMKKMIEDRFYKMINIAAKNFFGEETDICFVTEEEYSGKEQTGSVPAPAKPAKIKSSNNNNLNDRYTFDTFVVGNNNRFANAAAISVAESPAGSYNPLFIYGGVGLGKTHLMHSIAHFIIDQNKDMKVLYVSSEKFTNELIDSMRSQKFESGSNLDLIQSFRDKYRGIDVLLIDDIQFIAGKERTQEEFFHTFNALYDDKKQIIISSDRPPKEIETLEERLRSRFEWGLIVDIAPPDFETRMAILRNKAELENLNLNDEVLQYVAANIKSNIRELEGAVNKIVAFSRLINYGDTIINKKVAEEALKDLISNKETNVIDIETIVSTVSEHFGIDASVIKGKKRNKDVSYYRHIVMYLCRELTEMSFPAIADYLNRDHTTIIHGYEKINNSISTDEALRKTIKIIHKKITGN